jgi:hypothetical protein
MTNPQITPEEPYKHPERVASYFCRNGLEYYVAGRFSALSAKSLVVAGNILHHAIEMLLKGAICLRGSYTRQQIRAMGHDLRRAWKAFKKTCPDRRLDALDAAIKRLDKFEELRYPDKVMSSGMMGNFILKREHVASTHVSGPKAASLPKYTYIMEDVDELVKLIFDVAKVNPQFFPMYGDAPAMLRKDNDHPVL